MYTSSIYFPHPSHLFSFITCHCSIEDDFITWKEHFWAAVCEHFNVEKSGEDISFRQYQLIVHDEFNEEKIYRGEVARLNSYKTQKP